MAAAQIGRLQVKLLQLIQPILEAVAVAFAVEVEASAVVKRPID